MFPFLFHFSDAISKIEDPSKVRMVRDLRSDLLFVTVGIVTVVIA